MRSLSMQLSLIRDNSGISDDLRAELDKIIRIYHKQIFKPSSLLILYETKETITKCDIAISQINNPSLKQSCRNLLLDALLCIMMKSDLNSIPEPFSTGLKGFLGIDFFVKSAAVRQSKLNQLRFNNNFLQLLQQHPDTAGDFLKASVNNDAQLINNFHSNRLGQRFLPSPGQDISPINMQALQDLFRNIRNGHLNFRELDDNQVMLFEVELDQLRANQQPPLLVPQQEPSNTRQDLTQKIEQIKPEGVDRWKCPLSYTYIRHAVKLSSKNQHGEVIWHYFEKSYLERALAVKRENPLNREPIKPNEPLPAPEIEQEIRDFLKAPQQLQQAPIANDSPNTNDSAAKQLTNIKNYIEQYSFTVKTFAIWEGGVNLHLNNGKSIRVPHRVAAIYEAITKDKELSLESLHKKVKARAQEGLNNPRYGQSIDTRVFYQMVIEGTVPGQISTRAPIFVH